MPDADHEEFAEEVERPYTTVGFSDEVSWDKSFHVYVDGQRGCCRTWWGRAWFHVMGRHW